jgi:signal transduction histidine kinase
MIILLTSGAVLLLTCMSFFVYEFLTFRQSMVRQTSTLGKIVADSSTAALAFQNVDDAREILNALKAEPHIVAAGLYDKQGKLFLKYPANLSDAVFPVALAEDGYRFERSHLDGFQPVVQGDKRIGTLYLHTDLGALYDRFRLYSLIVVLVIAVSFLLAYTLSTALQKQISRPILALAETAKAVSERRDYSVRATTQGRDELGLLTDAFNQMLAQIEQRDTSLRANEEQLKHNAEELKRSNEELERFAYVASHDLQEPLRTVASFAQLLGSRFKGRLDSDADDFIHFIVDGATRMQTLINDLLTYSRVGTKGKPFEPVAADDAIRAVLNDLDRAIENNRAVVTHDPLPVIMADSVQLRQLLQNLIGNAIKFHKKGEPPRVHISAAPQNGKWEFRVRDSGIGIDPQYFDRVFIIFQRLHGPDEYAGTGIGLAVCKKIVERHAGRIWVESESGIGSTFCFTLPNGKAST